MSQHCRNGHITLRLMSLNTAGCLRDRGGCGRGGRLSQKDAAFEAVIVEGGLQLRCSETCCSGGDGGVDDAVAKVGEFGTDCGEEEKILPRLMNTLSPLFLRSRNLSRKFLSPPVASGPKRVI